MGLFTSSELDSFIASEFNPVRVAFHEGSEIWTKDVLNLGVSPVKLVDAARAVLQSNGGSMLEDTQLEGLSVHPDGCTLSLRQAGGSQILVSEGAGGSPVLVSEGACELTRRCPLPLTPASIRSSSRTRRNLSGVCNWSNGPNGAIVSQFRMW